MQPTSEAHRQWGADLRVLAAAALVIVALLLSVVSVTMNEAAAAQNDNECPSGFELSPFDDTTCFQSAQSRTTTSNPTCAAGRLTADRTRCFRPAVVTEQTRTEQAEPIVSTRPPTYTCPEGSVGSGSGENLTCSRTETVAPVAPAVSYSCPAGSTGSGSGQNLTCTTEAGPSTEEPVIATASAPQYLCPDGFETSGAGAALTCTRVVSAASSVPPIRTAPAPVYSCPAGAVGTGSGSALTCSRPVATAPIAPVATQGASTYSCPGGFSSSGAGAAVTCSRPIACPAGSAAEVACEESTPPVVAAAPTTFSCPQGSTASSGSGASLVCTGPAQVESVPVVVSQSPSLWNCPAGYSAVGGSGADLQCDDGQSAVETAPPIAAESTTTYACPTGTTGEPVAGGTCTRPGAGSETVDPIVSQAAAASAAAPSAPRVVAVAPNVSQSARVYSCPSGFTATGSGASTTCTKTISLDPKITCSTGGEPTLSGGDYVCIIGRSTSETSVEPHCPKGQLNSAETSCLLTIGSSGPASSLIPKFTG